MHIPKQPYTLVHIPLMPSLPQSIPTQIYLYMFRYIPYKCTFISTNAGTCKESQSMNFSRHQYLADMLVRTDVLHRHIHKYIHKYARGSKGRHMSTHIPTYRTIQPITYLILEVGKRSCVHVLQNNCNLGNRRCRCDWRKALRKLCTGCYGSTLTLRSGAVTCITAATLLTSLPRSRPHLAAIALHIVALFLLLVLSIDPGLRCYLGDILVGCIVQVWLLKILDPSWCALKMRTYSQHPF